MLGHIGCDDAEQAPICVHPKYALHEYRLRLLCNSRHIPVLSGCKGDIKSVTSRDMAPAANLLRDCRNPRAYSMDDQRSCHIAKENGSGLNDSNPVRMNHTHGDCCHSPEPMITILKVIAAQKSVCKDALYGIVDNYKISGDDPNASVDEETMPPRQTLPGIIPSQPISGQSRSYFCQQGISTMAVSPQWQFAINDQRVLAPDFPFRDHPSVEVWVVKADNCDMQDEEESVCACGKSKFGIKPTGEPQYMHPSNRVTLSPKVSDAIGQYQRRCPAIGATDPEHDACRQFFRHNLRASSGVIGTGCQEHSPAIRAGVRDGYDDDIGIYVGPQANATPITFDEYDVCSSQRIFEMLRGTPFKDVLSVVSIEAITSARTMPLNSVLMLIAMMAPSMITAATLAHSYGHSPVNGNGGSVIADGCIHATLQGDFTSMIPCRRILDEIADGEIIIRNARSGMSVNRRP